MLKMQAFYNILSRLSKREKFILYGAAFFISLTLLDRLIIAPVFSKMTSLDKEIQERQSDIRKSLHILSQKDRILVESAKYSSFLHSFKSEEEEVTFLLKEIENITNKTSVYLIDMKPAGLKDMASTKKYLINLNCEAQMEQLIDFMYNIENSNRLLTIEKYRITPKSKESSLAKCTMSISKIVIMPIGGDI